MSNYKKINFFSENADYIDSIHQKDSESLNVKSFSFVDIEQIFQEIFQGNQENNFPMKMNAISKLQTYSRHHINYSILFQTLKINEIIVEMLGVGFSIENQNIAIEIITRLAYISNSEKKNSQSESYLNDLVEANVIPALINLYYKRCDDNDAIVQAFAYIIKNNLDLRNQILNQIEISQFFRPLIGKMYNDQGNSKIYIQFLYNIIEMKNCPDNVVELYLSFTNEFLKQWINKPSTTNLMLSIIVECISDHPNFNAYVREIHMIDTALELIKEKINNDFLTNLLRFIGIVFENPVDFYIDLPFFHSLSQHQNQKVRICALFAIGNLFESTPITITQMYSLGFFDTLNLILEKYDGDTKKEAIICYAHAICFSNFEMRNKFLTSNCEDINTNFNLVEIICEGTVLIDVKLRYIIVQALSLLLETLAATSSSSEAINIFKSLDGFEILDSLNVSDDNDKFNAAVNQLKNTIQSMIDE